jgi:lipopolysaccharide export system permease protein
VLTTLDRYVLKMTLQRVGLVLVVALAALLLERMVRLLDLLAGNKAPALLVLRLFVSLVPHYLSLAISAAFFVGVLMALHRLSQDSELDAMFAAGRGLWRIARPIFLLGLALTVVGLVLVGFVQPRTQYAYRSLLHALSHASVLTALESGALVSNATGMTLSVGDIDDAGRQLDQVFLHQSGKAETLTLTAERAEILRAIGDDRPFVRLYDGVRIETRANAPEPITVAFDSFDLPLDETFEAEPPPVRGSREQELTLTELIGIRPAPPEGIDLVEIDAEVHGRVVRSLAIGLLPLIAVPLGIASRRTRRGVGLAFGTLIVVVFQQVVHVGEGFADNGELPVWLALDLPLLVLAVTGLLVFVAAARRPLPWWRAWLPGPRLSADVRA